MVIWAEGSLCICSQLIRFRRYEPGKVMYNLGNFNSGEDISDNYPLSPSVVTLNDPTHPMRMNWCGIINSDEFIWFQLTKIWQLLRFCFVIASPSLMAWIFLIDWSAAQDNSGRNAMLALTLPPFPIIRSPTIWLSRLLGCRHCSIMMNKMSSKKVLFLPIWLSVVDNKNLPSLINFYQNKACIDFVTDVGKAYHESCWGLVSDVTVAKGSTHNGPSRNVQASAEQGHIRKKWGSSNQ